MARSVQAGSMSSYFRKIFQDNPELLYAKSNDEVLQKFTEMTGEPITERHRANLNNLKSVLRREQRKKEGKQAPAGRAARSGNGAVAAPSGRGVSRLEQLEEAIDECLLHAKALDREGLRTAIRHLREARNEVVWKQGQK